MGYLLLLSVLMPILAGLFLLIGGMEDARRIRRFALIFVCLNALLVWTALLFGGDAGTTLVRFTDDMTLALKPDGFSRLFAGMVSVLWIFTTVYAFEYMEREGMEKKFFGFFLMSFGVVMGIAFARNLFTLYLFYEYLTFATLPLVMHQMSAKSRYAGRIYLTFSIAGGAAAFLAMMLLVREGVSLEFVKGGLGDAAGEGADRLRGIFLIALAGFGVKAALFPLHYWLPTASVAPTPVTALLHAVAVVKSGVFAIARCAYWLFGTRLLSGSFAQTVMIGISSFTIVYGSAMALRCPHLKRRLAYSTVSNLSYIVLGLSLLTDRGLTGAVLHMLLHGFLKITLFFCAGAILIHSGAEYVRDLKGYGKRMPVTMACFTLCGLGLIGVPPFGAFTSKYLMATAAASIASPMGYAGIAALLISEVLTCLYVFQPVVEAYFPRRDLPDISCEPCEAGKRMTVPMSILTACTLLTAIWPEGLIRLIENNL